MAEQTGPRGGTRPLRPDRDHERGDRRGGAGRPAAERLLPGLADGSLIGAAASAATSLFADGTASGNAGVVISGALADVLLVPCGRRRAGHREGAWRRHRQVPANLDPSRRAAKVRLEAAPATVLPGARGLLTDIARTVFAAEAAGHRRRGHRPGQRVRQDRGCSSAARSRRSRRSSITARTCWSRPSLRPRRPGTRAGPRVAGGDQLSYTAAIAATLAIPAAAAQRAAQHPGARRHRVHLGARRAPVPAPGRRRRGGRRRRAGRGRDVTDLVRRGVRRAAAIDLPPEAEPIRAADAGRMSPGCASWTATRGSRR